MSQPPGGVVVLGDFDLFHVGHVDLLGEATRRSRTVVVGVLDDRAVELLCRRPPVVPAAQRAEIVAAVRGVTCALVVDLVTVRHLLDERCPSAVLLPAAPWAVPWATALAEIVPVEIAGPSVGTTSELLRGALCEPARQGRPA